MKKRIIAGVVLSVFCILSGCTNNESNKPKEKIEIAVSKENKQLQYFLETHEGTTIIKAEEGDLNGDNLKDLLIIFKGDRDKVRMLAVTNNGDKYQCSNEISAPISKQKIEFKDIDKKSPMEVIVSGYGSKGNDFGYGIFRVEDNRIVDLFGDGMDSCCN